MLLLQLANLITDPIKLIFGSINRSTMMIAAHHITIFLLIIIIIKFVMIYSVPPLHAISEPNEFQTDCGKSKITFNFST